MHRVLTPNITEKRQKNSLVCLCTLHNSDVSCRARLVLLVTLGRRWPSGAFRNLCTDPHDPSRASAIRSDPHSTANRTRTWPRSRRSAGPTACQRVARRPSSRSASATTRPASNPRKASGVAAAPKAEATAIVIPPRNNGLCILVYVTKDYVPQGRRPMPSPPTPPRPSSSPRRPCSPWA